LIENQSDAESLIGYLYFSASGKCKKAP